LHEEEQHIDIREKLLNLPKMKASDDFVNALHRKINLSEAEAGQKKITEEVKESVWVKLFGKKKALWLVPSFGVTIVAFIVISIYLFPTNKDSVNNIVSKDSDKKVMQESPAVKDKEEELKKDELTEKDLAGNFTGKEETPSLETGRISKEKADLEKISMPKEMEIEKSPAPMKYYDKLDPDQSGRKMEINDEKKSDGAERKVMEETITPVDSKVKSTEVEQNVKKVDKSKEGSESKGAIENKEKMSMKKSGKNTTDSTKIDKKTLEKIKEELEKSVQEK
jgi:hypothetical protein